MRTIFYSALAVLIMTACNSKTEETTKAAATETTELPYNLQEPHNDWQIGKQENVKLVMNMIKSWETKNFTQCAGYFADTVNLNFDFSSDNLPQDSLVSFLEGSWENMASVQIIMQDWESVISKDKKSEWVTLWYKQINTDTKGNIDSLNLINDAKIENGKIAIFSEYVQHFPEAKKK
jgi:hypothetical protein